MIFPCATQPISCPGQSTGPGSIEYDTPIYNLTSEAPDAPAFIGVSFGTSDDPPLGSSFTSVHCFTTCTAPTQALADDCAQTNASECDISGWYDAGQSPIFSPTQEPGPGGNGAPAGTGGGSQPYAPNTNNPTPIQSFPNDPQSCSVACGGGLAPYTYTVPAKKYYRNTTALADAVAQADACAEAQSNNLCLAVDLPYTACVNHPYAGGSVTASGTAAQVTFSLGGDVPDGITLTQTSGSTAAIGGTPTQGGFYSLAITGTAMASDGKEMIQSINSTINVLEILPSPLPTGTVNSAYSAQLTFEGGMAPFTFSGSGSLPPGLSMTASGLITGTPTIKGTYPLTLIGTDAQGETCSAAAAITIAPAGPNWGALAWACNAYCPDNYRAAQYGSWNGSGNNFSFSARGDGSNYVTAGSTIAHGTYQGGPASGVLTLSGTGTGYTIVSVSITQNGNPICSAGGFGTYPFSVANSPTSVPIVVTVTWQAGDALPPHFSGSLTGSGSIFNT